MCMRHMLLTLLKGLVVRSWLEHECDRINISTEERLVFRVCWLN